jgi:hypothetical protein
MIRYRNKDDRKLNFVAGQKVSQKSLIVSDKVSYHTSYFTLCYPVFLAYRCTGSLITETLLQKLLTLPLKESLDGMKTELKTFTFS